MPTHTHYEQLLLGKFQEIRALQDEKKKAEATARSGGSRRPIARPGSGPVGAKAAPQAAARPGPKAADVGPPGETPHQRAIRLLKAKQAKQGSGVSPAVAAATGLRRPGAAGSTAHKPGSRGPGPSASKGDATAGKPALKRPSMKRPSVKRPAPGPAPQSTESPSTAGEDASQAPPAKFARPNTWARSSEGTTLFVGDLPPGTNHMHLQEWFEPMGNVVNTRAITNFGFVTFDDPETARNALNSAQANPIVVDGYQLKVNWSKGSGGGDRNRRGPPVERAGYGGGGREGGHGGFHDRVAEEPQANPWDDLDRSDVQPSFQPEPSKVPAARGHGREHSDDAADDDSNRAAIVYDDL